MSGAAKAFEEAHERHERGHDGPRWIPVVAAVLAVLAAISGFVSNVRSTKALVAKNDSIVATTHASDTYNQYQAGRIKYYVYQAAIDASTARDAAKLLATANREKTKGAPLLKKAQAYEDEAARDNDRSESLLLSHEIIEVATTLFEVSIVLVSITALVGSRLLPIVAGIASLGGVVIFLVGLSK